MKSLIFAYQLATLPMFLVLLLFNIPSKWIPMTEFIDVFAERMSGRLLNFNIAKN
jgi:hypothetical protein